MQYNIATGIFSVAFLSQILGRDKKRKQTTMKLGRKVLMWAKNIIKCFRANIIFFKSLNAL